MLLGLTDEMANRSLSFHTALQDLAMLLHRIALAQTVPGGLPGDWPEREEILRLAGLFEAEEIQLFYQIVLHGKQELGLAPDEYAGFSMTLLRMLAFRPRGVGEQLAVVPAAQASGQARSAMTAGRTAALPQRPATAAATSATASAALPAAAAPAASVAATPTRPAQAGLDSARISPGKAALLAARGIAPDARASSGAAPSGAAPSGAASASESVPMSPPAAAEDLAPPPWVTQEDEGDGSAAQKKTLIDSGSDAEPTGSAGPAGSAGLASSAEEGRRAISKAQQDAANAAMRVAEGIAAKAAARAAGSLPEPEIVVAPIENRPQREKMAAPPFALHPVGDWDGDWPALTAQLPLRGVVQQLAWQTELQAATRDGNCIDLHLRCELETLCSPQNMEKMVAALSEFFGLTARIKSEIGLVWHTAHARAEAARAARQREAEQVIRNDPFVQALMREFGASVVPDSIHPILEEAAL